MKEQDAFLNSKLLLTETLTVEEYQADKAAMLASIYLLERSLDGSSNLLFADGFAYHLKSAFELGQRLSM